MKILVVAATKEEITPSFSFFEERNIEVLITGVGMVATGFALGVKTGKQEDYDLIINAGIAGSFTQNIQIGEVVEVVEDELSELGAQDHGNFIPIETLGFGRSLFSANNSLSLHLTKVKGITVNTIHGDTDSIAKVQLNRGEKMVESMEGAAVFYAAEVMKIPVLQLRSISNYVEPRNRNNWNIPLAIKTLNEELQSIIRDLL